VPRRRLAEPAPDARALALDVLLRVERTDAFADVLLARRLADARLPTVEQALATRLVYGTLAWQGRLDFHLDALLSRTPVARLPPRVRAALRLGLYQLLFLERVPAYAAVDTSVAFAGGAGAGMRALANAVLRRAATLGRAGLALPDASDPMTRLAVEWSHPRWLVERWVTELGAGEAAALLAADNEHAATTIRARPGTREALAAELDAAGVAATPGLFAPDALLVERGGARLRGSPAWREGRLAFQGEASQLVVPLLGLEPGVRVLDVCAAPGGKTAHAAALGGRVVALDRRFAGVLRIRDEAARLGLAHVVAAVGDARRPPVAGPFDAVLVDAPCSGLGTLRRHPELRWRRRPEDVARLADLQRAILAAVADLVRPGGVLVYAVCTLTREENEETVAAFQRGAPRFAVEDARAHLPASAAATVDGAGFLRTLPHRHGLDGFFAARLRAG
jgi:16S rRNA (cytosine967-C5)-methyltransferase